LLDQTISRTGLGSQVLSSAITIAGIAVRSWQQPRFDRNMLKTGAAGLILAPSTLGYLRLADGDTHTAWKTVLTLLNGTAIHVNDGGMMSG
jgi:hypothetical protein